MKPPNVWDLLPHEAVFGLFLVVTWARLALTLGPGSSEALVYLTFCVTNVVLLGACRRQPTKLRWRLRLWFYPVALNVLFPHMKGAVPKIHPGSLDALLQQVDTWLIGKNLSLRCASVATPWLTELLSICYLLFFPYLLFSLIYYGCDDLALFKKFMVGLFTIYGVGFLGYTWVPASGPYVAMSEQFTTPLTGWRFTEWNAKVVSLGSNGVDVFPSLHCAVSCYFLFFDRRHRPWRFKLYLLPCLGLWLSTVYLRYHYFIDLVCGFALSALALWVANRFHAAQTACQGAAAAPAAPNIPAPASSGGRPRRPFPLPDQDPANLQSPRT
jgi:membrane-associated phospholipid phosphatase